MYFDVRLCGNSGCWTETNDVHGFGGVAHNMTTLDECQSACVDNNTCVSIDWDSSNAEKSCWIQTSTVTAATMETGFIRHYELNRSFLSQSYLLTSYCSTLLVLVSRLLHDAYSYLRCL